MTDTQKILEEFDKEFMQPDNYPWMGTDVTGNEIKKFLITKIQEAVAEERARVVGEIPNLLHTYGKWLLENSNAEPLERRAKKQLIATSLLDEELTKKD